MTPTSRALLLAFLALILGGLGGVRIESWKADSAAAKVAKASADREAKAARELAALTAKYRKAEQDHSREVAAIREEYQRHENQARADDAAAIADLKSGTHRLRLQVAKCQAAGAAAPDGAGPAVDGAGAAELAPATAAALYGIASDGDRAIRKLTALQAWATSAMKLCNGVQP